MPDADNDNDNNNNNNNNIKNKKGMLYNIGYFCWIFPRAFYMAGSSSGQVVHRTFSQALMAAQKVTVLLPRQRLGAFSDDGFI